MRGIQAFGFCAAVLSAMAGCRRSEPAEPAPDAPRGSLIKSGARQEVEGSERDASPSDDARLIRGASPSLSNTPARGALFATAAPSAVDVAASALVPSPERIWDFTAFEKAGGWTILDKRFDEEKRRWLWKIKLTSDAGAKKLEDAAKVLDGAHGPHYRVHFCNTKDDVLYWCHLVQGAHYFEKGEQLEIALFLPDEKVLERTKTIRCVFQAR